MPDNPVSTRRLTDEQRAEMKALNRTDLTPAETERRNALVALHNADALDALDTMQAAKSKADAVNYRGRRGRR